MLLEAREKLLHSKEAPFGEWESPISTEMVAGRTITIEQLHSDRGTIYWTESRSGEEGRSVIVRRSSAGDIETLTPDGFDVRTRVHDYGGKAFISRGDEIYFSNYLDGRIYKQDGENIHSITPEGNFSYADFILDVNNNRLICVRQEERGEDEPLDAIVAIKLDDKNEVEVLMDGNDFYSSPRISPDGSKLAWQSWDHPNMPWDSSRVSFAEFDESGRLHNITHGATNSYESAMQPLWSPDGSLYFISDRNGWWNLYRMSQGGDIIPVREQDAEYADAQWEFGNSTFGFIDKDKIVAAYNRAGEWRLEVIDTNAHEAEEMPLDLTDISHVSAENDSVYFIGASHLQSPALMRLSCVDNSLTAIRKSSEFELDSGYLSEAELIQFPTGEEDDLAYGLYYGPKNKDFHSPPGEKPPLLLITHGGPTGAISGSLDLETQYWTSRGFAVFVVNYRGSTGYGREYREKLNGQWGVADVEDCINGAKYLIKEKDIDEERLIMRGYSAGGFTALAALTESDIFKAAASYYGVSDLEKLREFIGKLESHYFDRLIGPYPEAAEVFRKRSPIHRIGDLTAPIILFQGLEDPVVSPEQSRQIFEAAVEKGLQASYIEFPGEGHGFRRAQTIKDALQAELYFYGKVFGFEPPDNLPPIDIHNLTE